MAAGNAAALEIIAHRGKGASANFGIRAMVRPLEALEETARKGDLSNATALLAEANEALTRVRKAVSDRFEAA